MKTIKLMQLLLTFSIIILFHTSAFSDEVISVDELVPKYCKYGENNFYSIEGKIQSMSNCKGYSQEGQCKSCENVAVMIAPKMDEGILFETTSSAPDKEGECNGEYDPGKKYYIKGFFTENSIYSFLSARGYGAKIDLKQKPRENLTFFAKIGLSKVYNGDDLLKTICIFPDKKLKIKGHVTWGDKSCTKMACNDKNPCCNGCWGNAVIKGDKLSITLDGIRCAGNDCEMKCGDFSFDKEYIFTGNLSLYKDMDTWTRYVFKLESFAEAK